MPSAAVATDGFYLTPGYGPDIQRFDTAGALQAILRIDAPLPPVTSSVLDRYAEIRLPVIAAPSFRDVLPRMPTPDSLPLIDQLLVDELGWLWARQYDFEPAAPGLWFVFDPDGTARGTVGIPRHL